MLGVAGRRPHECSSPAREQEGGEPDLGRDRCVLLVRGALGQQRGQQFDERLDQSRIERRPGFPFEQLDRVGLTQGFVIGPFRGDRVEVVDDGENDSLMRPVGILTNLAMEIAQILLPSWLVSSF